MRSHIFVKTTIVIDFPKFACRASHFLCVSSGSLPPKVPFSNTRKQGHIAITIHIHAFLHSQVSLEGLLWYSVLAALAVWRLLKLGSISLLGSNYWGRHVFYLRSSNGNQNVHGFKQNTQLYQSLPKHRESSQVIFVCLEEWLASPQTYFSTQVMLLYHR